MKKMKGKIQSFFGEFKKFITRGNVLDMAVGIMVGGAFTAIVTALSNNILKPLINFLLALLLGKDGLTGIYTFLKRGYDETGAFSLANSIYINWGEFINAAINFLLIAFVLFCIVRAINKFAAANGKMKEQIQLEAQAVKKYRGEGLTRRQAKERYFQELAAENEKKEEEERIAAEKAAEEKAKAEAVAEERAGAESRLLEEIRDLLKELNEKK